MCWNRVTFLGPPYWLRVWCYFCDKEHSLDKQPQYYTHNYTKHFWTNYENNYCDCELSNKESIVYAACVECFNKNFILLDTPGEIETKEVHGSIYQKVDCYYNRDPGVDIKSARK